MGSGWSEAPENGAKKKKRKMREGDASEGCCGGLEEPERARKGERNSRFVGCHEKKKEMKSRGDRKMSREREL